jgi:hypothetical protein
MPQQIRIERAYAYIEDGDLWRKALPFSKEFSTYPLLPSH